VIGRSNFELTNVVVLDTSVYQCVFDADVIGIVLLEVIGTYAIRLLKKEKYTGLAARVFWDTRVKVEDKARSERTE